MAWPSLVARSPRRSQVFALPGLMLACPRSTYLLPGRCPH
jgi:hypothetical protein